MFKRVNCPAILCVALASVLMVAGAATTVGAQTSAAARASRAAVARTNPFAPLDLPAGNQYRTGSGRPGPAYWQNRADYSIDAHLVTSANVVTGNEKIHYTNNSPTALTYVWMYVEQNICNDSSITNVLNQPPLQFQDAVFDFSCKGYQGSAKVEMLSVGGASVRAETHGTTMKVYLPAPLASGSSIDISLLFTSSIPVYGAGRMGRDGDEYEIAQWYPRMAVYDDIKGWNTEPYIGAGEFYLEYGNFDVSLEVPEDYLVAATGVLQNASTVLSPTQMERLTRARTSDSPVQIVTDEEARTAPAHRMTRFIGRDTRGAGSPPTMVPVSKTWIFHADNVRDFAFASGPHLRWDAVNYDGTLVQVFYRRNADKWAAEGINVARHAIKFFSEHWFRYPYPQATTIEGPIEGMEYPMLTFVPNSKGREDFQWTLMHEFGHQWFPMTVGSNERLYPWMDEGFNTYIDLAGAADYFRGTPYGDSIQDNPLHQYPAHAIANEQPLMTAPVQSHDLFWTGYRKPALMMRMLREQVLGPERFDAAFREYIAAWAFKHPAPPDFMRVMSDASGMDLDWFWRGWLYTTSTLDQSVDGIGSDSMGSIVHLSNRSTMVMPAQLRLTFAGGKTETVKLPVEMWYLGSSFDYHVPRAADGRKRVVVQARLDPGNALPDTNRNNNVWPRK